jgi:hypothetical protein
VRLLLAILARRRKVPEATAEAENEAETLSFCSFKTCTPTQADGYRFTFFFHLFFLLPISVLFAEKVNPRWLQLNLFFVSPTCHHNLLCWESLLMLWRQDNSPSAHTISTIMSFPPPPSAPGGGGYHGRSGGRGNGKLYLATQKACAAAA